jgi:dTDP-4-dehydrorhamnose 3,5-epimerase
VILREAGLAGAHVLDLERRTDDRGWFARAWAREELAEHGLSTAVEQCNISANGRRGTLRGMHLQLPPHEEVKLVRCVRGAVYDVLVDLRPESPTHGRWVSFELSEENGTMLYIPAGVAHGFQTLTDDATLFYMMSAAYAPEAARGVRWDDPAFGISWPSPHELVIAPRDREWPDYVEGLYPGVGG